jgi:hypothetical protein
MRYMTAVLALAAAGGLTMGAAQAMTMPGAPMLSANVEQIAGKAKKARPGSCGVNMYYDKKTKQCADARTKT